MRSIFSLSRVFKHKLSHFSPTFLIKLFIRDPNHTGLLQVNICLSLILSHFYNRPSSGSPGAVESRRETRRQIFLKACPYFDKSWNFTPQPSSSSFLPHIALFRWSVPLHSGSLCRAAQWTERGFNYAGIPLKAEADTRNSLRTSRHCACS